MLSKKRVALTKLVSYILSFNINNTNNEVLEKVFLSQVKSNDEFVFKCLNFGESKNINDFPEKLKAIFDPFIKDLIRHGAVKKFDDNDTNLSLYFSILSLLVKNFDNLPSRDQLNFIQKLRDKLIICVSNDEHFKSHDYDKLGWVKKDIINSFVQFKINKLVLKILADYFNVNIFLLNIIEDKVYVISENDFYDMFRPNLLLVFTDDIFEPLTYCNTSVLDYNTSPIKKLITIDKNMLILLDTNLKEERHLSFNIQLSNLNKFVKKEIKIEQKNVVNEIQIQGNVNNTLDTVQLSEKVEDVHGVDNEYGEVTVEDSEANIDSTHLTFKLSAKMKLDELQLIAKKLNIIIEKDGTKKKKTKNELMSEINANLPSVPSAPVRKH
jgi:hypothetical protein